MFAPTVAPDTLREHPEAAPGLLREVLDWLEPNTGGRPPEEVRETTRQAVIAAGLYAAEYPEDVGGYGLPQTMAAELRRQAAASGLPYSRHVLTAYDGPNWLLLDGTPAQRECWLQPLITGKWTRCLAMTEPRGGSDLRGLATTAVRTARGWRLDGRKFMISNAGHADLAIVLARVTGAERGGPTFFAFTTDTPGWRVVRPLPGMEPDYQQFEVELDGVELDFDAVVGGPAGIGAAFGLAGDWLPYGRIALAARAVGLGEWALGVARRYAAGRDLGGGRLDDKQYVREMLVRSDVDLTASWLLVREAAAALDANRVAVRETAVAKLHATETACRVVDDAIQVLGGRGWLSEYGLERAYREARLFRIVDGASELLKETIFTLGENR